MMIFLYSKKNKVGEITNNYQYYEQITQWIFFFNYPVWL